MFDPSICPAVETGMPANVQIALISAITVFGTALITLLQTLVQERIRKVQTAKATVQMASVVENAMETKAQAMIERNSPTRAITPIDERVTPRDKPAKPEDAKKGGG